MTRTTTIPFLPRFVEPIRAGRKTLTARPRPYGKPGDVLNSPAGPIVLEAVDRIELGAVADMWESEGCHSRADFKAVWTKLHPRAGWQPRQKVYLHRFHLLAAESPRRRRERTTRTCP